MNDYSIPIGDAYRNRLYQLIRKGWTSELSKREDRELYDRLMMLNMEAGKSQNDQDPDRRWLRLDTTNDPLRPWDNRLDMQVSSGDLWICMQHGSSARIKTVATISIENISLGATTSAWQDLPYAAVDDANSAKAGVCTYNFYPYWEHSDYLLARVSPMSLPIGAKNICVRLMVKKSRLYYATNHLLFDDNVHLFDGSTIISSEDKASTDQWSINFDSPATFYYGDTDDAWGATLTPTLLNSGTFGVGISVFSNGGSAVAWAGVYYMEVEIYYDLDDRFSLGYDEGTGFFVLSPGAGLDGSGRFQFGGSQLLLPATTGTAPIVQSSTTLNVNLNADLLDGKHYADVTADIAAANTVAIDSILTYDGEVLVDADGNVMTY